MKKILLTTIVVLLAVALNAQVSVWDGTAEPWTKGSGTPDDPYLIESAQNFAYLAEKTNEVHYANYNYHDMFVDTCFLLTADLDLGGSEGHIWIPIAQDGMGYTTYCFGGNFDGANHTISNLLLKDGNGRKYMGLFGHANGGYIKNIVLDGDMIIIPSFHMSGIPGGLGLIIGFGENVEVENCVNSFDVTCERISFEMGGSIGGLFGKMQNAFIQNCHNYGNITVQNVNSMYSAVSCGGIVGNLTACEMTECSSRGSMQMHGGDSYLAEKVSCGGIAGTMSGTLTNCYNNGDLTVAVHKADPAQGLDRNAGGLIGSCYSDDELIVTNSYGVSDIVIVADDEPYNMGGIVGFVKNAVQTTIDNCYYLNTIESGNDYGTPKSEDEMKSEEFIGLLNADEEVFFMDTYGYLNDGFPILKWQHESHVGVDETDWQGNVAVYPNPVQSLVTVSGENLKELEVINILGQPVLKIGCSGESVTIDLANQPAGVYFIKITDKNGRNYSEKVVRE
jgi:hypothetical protein